jgi:hypothetical protein
VIATRPIRDRLTSRLRSDGECKVFVGPRTKKGYGKIGEGGRGGRILSTHRVAWELEHGPIPDGLCVLHRCDNPPCCNVDHLFLGTKADNNADMVAKGRAYRGPRLGRIYQGESHVNAKLTDEAARAIRNRRLAGEGVAALAREYGVSCALVCNIARGRSRPLAAAA